jgi:ATP-binding cassette subfamily B protein
METINLKKLLYDAILENKILLYSTIPLLTSYWLQDIVFSKAFGNFIANIPSFVKTIDTKSISALLLPYIGSHILFYINDLIIANVFPTIELNIIKDVSNKAIESMKKTKKPIETNEFIMNLKKILDIKNMYFLMTSYILPTIVVCIALIYYFIITDTKSSVIIIIMIFLLILITFNLQTECVNSASNNQESLNDLFDNIHDIITNSDTVITAGQNSQDKELINIEKLKNVSYEKYVNSEINANDSAFKLRMLSLGFTIAAEAIAVSLYLNNKINTSQLMSISLLSVLFMEYYNSAVFKFKSMVQHIGKFFEINDYFSKFILNNNTNKLAPNLKINKGNIKFENINLTFGNKKIFNNFNLVLNGGIKTCIRGNIGSGKTTLLKMLVGLITYQGNIYIDNQNINKCNYESIIKNIVYIPQHPKMFNKTMYYNLNYGSNYTEKEIWDIINKFNLTNFFNTFPNKLSTMVGKEGKNLSGGQKQFISFVKALIQNKKIILLDEPTSSLDVNIKKLFIYLITQIKDKTIIISTHDETILFLFDKIIQI